MAKHTEKGNRMRLYLFIVTFLALSWRCTSPAQTVDDPNEGCQLSPDPTVPGAYNFSWWGKGGRTYFVQQSDDLINWTYVPIIEPGADQVTGYGFTSTSEKFFVRLKYADIPTDDPFSADFDGDGVSNWDELLQGTDPLGWTDSDGNGLPDDWEMFYFGYIGVDPAADDDQDGVSNLQEYISGSSPTNYYNGSWPYINIISGGNQQGEQGEMLTLPITIEVISFNDNYSLVNYNNAPVTFAVTNGGALLSSQPDQSSPQSSSIDMRATQSYVDVDGSTHRVAQVYVHLPNLAGDHSTISITAQAGMQTQTAFATVATTNPNLLPPSNLSATATSYSTVQLSWTPSDSSKQTVIEESYDQGYSWRTVLHVPAGQSSVVVDNLYSDIEVWFRAYTDDN